MATLIDDAAAPVVVTRTIVVTPEPPDPGGPVALNPMAIATAITIAATLSDASLQLDPAVVATTITLTATLTDLAVPLDPAPITISQDITATLTDPSVLLDPASLAVTLTVAVTRLLGDSGIVDCPAITVAAGLSAASAEAVPAIALSLGASGVAVSALLTLSSPEDGVTVGTATPSFMVVLAAHDETLTYTIEIQYDDNAGFIHPVTLVATAPAVDGGVIITPTSAVPDTTYWRARLLLNAIEQLGWTAAHSFFVSAQIVTVTLPVTWTADPLAARPIHLWHFDPAGPNTGDLVTAFGQGFPAAGHLLLGDAPLPVVSWHLVAASGLIPRTIDGDVVTCEHHEVTFTAPAVNGPGDALTVEA